MLKEVKGGNGHGIVPTSNPDFLINGRAFDVYSPQGNSKVRNVMDTVVKNKTETQASRIILNLDDFTGSIPKLKNQLDEWPIETLEELLIIRDGKITRWF